MSVNIAAYSAICNNCLERFDINNIFTIAVNLDNMNSERESFKSGKLNVISCPKCGKSFIYEVPMIIYSEKLRLVYYVEPRLDKIESELMTRTPFAFMGNGYKYRIMHYQNQAKEKYLIELSGLSDIAVEYIKLVSFSDDLALPFDNCSIEFISRKEDLYCFGRYDCLGELLNTYEVEFPDSKLPEKLYDIDPYSNKWQRIDRLSLLEFKEEL